MKRHGLKKGLSLLLVLCLILSLVPMTALAEEVDEPDAVVETEEETSAPAGEEKQEETSDPAEEEKQEETSDPAEEEKQEETSDPAEEEKQEETSDPAEEEKQEETSDPAEEEKQEETPDASEEEEEKSFIDEIIDGIIDGIKDDLKPITGEKTPEEIAAEEEAQKAAEEAAQKAAEEEAAKKAEEERQQALAEEAAKLAAIEEAEKLTLAEEIKVSFSPITVADQPEDDTTTGQPFIGVTTGGSDNFRIPALVTLPNGTLVAAADARWNNTTDGFGLDTVVSWSDDEGATWNYTFANYLGDNGNVYNTNSTAFIDPCLAVDGSTIYMLVDLYPAGTYIGNVKAGTGFDGNGNLLLRKSDETDFNYYLSDGKIWRISDNVQATDYEVDEYFNLTDPDGATTNLFFSNSPFKVLATSYLYLTKSTNGGKTWSAPMMLNPKVKDDSDSFYGVGPGRGLVTSTGRIIFPCYTYSNGSDGCTSVIYSDNGGVTWRRSDDMSEQSSEAALVEADGRIYMFTRHGGCYISENDGKTWSERQDVGIPYTTTCQLSAITYSAKIDGKTAILLSAPTNDRNNGKIFVGLVNEDGSIKWKYTYAVNNGAYAYSCLTELEDGSIGLLYEDRVDYSAKVSSITFETYSISEIADGATVEKYISKTDNTLDVTVSAPNLGSMTVSKASESTPYTGYTASVTYNIQLFDTEGGEYHEDADIEIPYDSQLFKGCEEFIGTVDGGYSFAVTLKNGYLVGTVPHFSEVTISGRALPNPLAGEVVPILGDTKYVLDTDGITDGEYLIVYSDYALKNNSGSAGKASVTISGNEATVTDTTGILWTFSGSDGNFTIQNGSYYLYLHKGNGWFGSSDVLGTNATSCTLTGNSGTYTIHGSNRYLEFYDGRYDSYWTIGSNGTAVSLYRKTTTSGGWAVDLSELKPQIDEAKALTEADYTAESWAVLKRALDDATSLYSLYQTEKFDTYEAAQKEQNEIDAAALALQEAINALQLAPKQETATISIGQTIKYPVASGAAVSGGNTKIAIATVSGTVLSITGVAVGETTFKVGQDTYRVIVKDIEMKFVTVAQNASKTLSVDNLTEGQYVEWSSENSAYVSVAGKYDADTGAYTNEGVIIGNKPTDDPVVVTGIVYNADGTESYQVKWLVTVTQAVDTNTSSRHIYVNVTEIENCDVYYSVNGGELVKVNGTGVLVDEKITGHYNIMFFAAPHEGYALTYMCVTGSGNQYYTLSNGNPDGTGSDAWPFVSATQDTIPTSSDSADWKTINGSKHGFRWALLEGNMSIEQMKVLFSNAIALGCDGATNFTKNGAESFYTEVQFVAQPLPSMEKNIVSITHESGTTEAYTEGMKVELGDTINYEIRVVKPAYMTGGIYTDNSYNPKTRITSSNSPSYTTGSYGTITYSNETLNDALTNVIDNKSAFDLGTSGSREATYTFKTSLHLTMANFASVVRNGTITNVADFKYSYKSSYSTGTLSKKANAVAEIVVEVPEYVIDFGLPVTIDLIGVLDTVTISSGDASYGEVTPRGTSFTYTPTEILRDVEFVTLTLDNGGSYGVRIYPATTVYYEEGFMVAGKNTGTGTQTASLVGSKAYYGYDAAYASTIGDSNGTVYESKTPGTEIASFGFTGTGVDIYARCTKNSGSVLITVKKGRTVQKMAVVNTAMVNGDTPVTSGQAVTAYNVPIVSFEDLPYDTYSVTISHVGKTGNVYLDGCRIHGTLKMDHEVYEKDNEKNPNIVELRDLVILNINTDASEQSKQYKDQIVKTTKAQVLNKNASAAVVKSYTGTAGITAANLVDVIDNGPKNEIYLSQNDQLVFNVGAGQTVQVGVKALTDGASGTINSHQPVNSSTDMFYKVTAGDDGLVTIKGTAGVLAVTELKFCS